MASSARGAFIQVVAPDFSSKQMMRRRCAGGRSSVHRARRALFRFLDYTVVQSSMCLMTDGLKGAGHRSPHFAESRNGGGGVFADNLSLNSRSAPLVRRRRFPYAWVSSSPFVVHSGIWSTALSAYKDYTYARWVCCLVLYDSRSAVSEERRDNVAEVQQQQ